MVEGRKRIKFYEGEGCRQVRPIRAAWVVDDCSLYTADWAILPGTSAHLLKQREVN